LTSRGDTKNKLEYVFTLYDLDNNGYIEKNEIKPVLLAMFTLLGSVFKEINILIFKK
jgi:Ca2+-binding EF-hand superfamily protein